MERVIVFVYHQMCLTHGPSTFAALLYVTHISQIWSDKLSLLSTCARALHSPIKPEQLIFIPVAGVKSKIPLSLHSNISPLFMPIKVRRVLQHGEGHLPVINCGWTPGGAAPSAADLRSLQRRLGDLKVAVRAAGLRPRREPAQGEAVEGQLPKTTIISLHKYCNTRRLKLRP